MNKDTFYKKAFETGANNCIYFNWDWKYRENFTCSPCPDVLEKCVLFDGGYCDKGEGKNAR